MTFTNAIVTAYCACKICCGDSSPGINAAGRKPVQGISIAAPRNVPLGTLVRIQGMTNVFRVDDRTARRYDGRFDIYFESHQAARQWGIQRRNVTIQTRK